MVQRNPWSSKSKCREALGHSHGVQGKTRQGRWNFTPNTLKARTHPLDGQPPTNLMKFIGVGEGCRSIGSPVDRMRSYRKVVVRRTPLQKHRSVRKSAILDLKLGHTQPKISCTIPTSRHTTIPNDSGSISACFKDEPTGPNRKQEKPREVKIL